VTGRTAARPAACGECDLGRARRQLGRALAELEQARLSWGAWADSVRKLAERRLGVSAAQGFAVLEDPGYAGALRLGGWFDDAVVAAGSALEVAGGGAGAVCPCLAAGEQ
jgi:hypothetical protein